MKKILIIVVTLFSVTAFGQAIPLAPVNFQVNADHALSKFEDALFHPEDLLHRMRPAGVKVSNKNVSHNEISFTATKTLFLVSKSVYVHGVFEANEARRGCNGNEKGYLLRMHFESSSHWVTDNVQELRALVCLRENSLAKISGQVRGQIIKGARYSNTLGPMAVNLIRDQVDPLLNALAEEIRSMR